MSGTSSCRVVVLARPGFLGDYVADGLRRVGLAVAGPVGTAGELELADTPCQGAVLDIGVEARELLLAVELLTAARVPTVLIGSAKSRLPVLLQDRPVLLQPFAGYQVVERLRAAGLPLTGIAPMQA